MAKFYGAIGYVRQIESPPNSGVWTDDATEKYYRGDVILSQQRWQPSEQLHDNFNLDNSISIVADEYAYANCGFIKYIVWHGQKWRIQSLSIQRPRIVLQIGGIYNGG